MLDYTVLMYQVQQKGVVIIKNKNIQLDVTSLLEIIMDTTFDAVSTESKIHILLSSKVHIVLEIKYNQVLVFNLLHTTDSKTIIH